MLKTTQSMPEKRMLRILQKIDPKKLNSEQRDQLVKLLKSCHSRTFGTEILSLLIESDNTAWIARTLKDGSLPEKMAELAFEGINKEDLILIQRLRDAPYESIRKKIDKILDNETSKNAVSALIIA